MKTWQRMFVQHPHSVNESYFEHLRFAGRFASRLMLAGGAATVHAVIPCLFEKTASSIIEDLHLQLSSRN